MLLSLELAAFGVIIVFGICSFLRVFTNIFITSFQLCFPAPYFLEVILECLSSHQFLNVGS